MKKMLAYSKKNSNRGFSFIELIIVIAITGVIPAVVFPLCLNYYELPQIQMLSKK
ncbi:MAG TPA: hypothetical protein DEV81_21125 [Cyanobacteria bacterium UBA11049]|nr:hypothetical protein [Cyanobacteria bacterium UBA11049]